MGNRNIYAVFRASNVLITSVWCYRTKNCSFFGLVLSRSYATYVRLWMAKVGLATHRTTRWSAPAFLPRRPSPLPPSLLWLFLGTEKQVCASSYSTRCRGSRSSPTRSPSFGSAMTGSAGRTHARYPSRRTPSPLSVLRLDACATSFRCAPRPYGLAVLHLPNPTWLRRLVFRVSVHRRRQSQTLQQHLSDLPHTCRQAYQRR